MFQGENGIAFKILLVCNLNEQASRGCEAENTMFADDIVICEKSRAEAVASPEIWRTELERRGMKISGAKTKYLCLNGGEGTKKLQDTELVRTKDFTYLGSTIQEY